MERKRYMLEGRYGEKYLPTSGRVWGNIAIGLLILYVVAYGEPQEGMSDDQVMLFKWLLVGWVVFFMMDFHFKASAFGHARRAYERRRAELLAGDLELTEDWEDVVGAEWIVDVTEQEGLEDLMDPEMPDGDPVPQEDAVVREGAWRGRRSARGTRS